jgi:hypothetical protein
MSLLPAAWQQRPQPSRQIRVVAFVLTLSGVREGPFSGTDTAARKV